jgi:site-specific DNA-adenine methylase
VDHYIEPFAGGAATLLGRPAWHAGDVETLNDANGLIVNAWRAICYAPGPLAALIEGPSGERARPVRLRASRSGAGA